MNERPAEIGHSQITLEITGKDLSALNNEAGGHRIQRVPPTERRGRVHTSTVTVAVLSEEQKVDPRYEMLEDHHFYVEWFSGTGAGGQHRNKHQNSCRLYHLPTGLVETRQSRSRDNNLRDARTALVARLKAGTDALQAQHTAQTRKGQVGTGMRGDKRRTYRFQDDRVTDHETGMTASTKSVMRGDFRALWR